MIELFVAAMCVQGYACNSAAKAYVMHNPAPKIWAKGHVARVEDAIGREYVVAASVAAAVTQGYSYQIKIDKEFAIGKIGNNVMLIYERSF